MKVAQESQDRRLLTVECVVQLEVSGSCADAAWCDTPEHTEMIGLCWWDLPFFTWENDEQLTDTSHEQCGGAWCCTGPGRRKPCQRVCFSQGSYTVMWSVCHGAEAQRANRRTEQSLPSCISHSFHCCDIQETTRELVDGTGSKELSVSMETRVQVPTAAGKSRAQ